MQTLLFKLGLILFLMGLLTGLAVPVLKNSRMGLSSHLEGVLNGMFLALLGLPGRTFTYHTCGRLPRSHSSCTPRSRTG